MKGQTNILLWPPHPDRRSWKDDTPNEGLGFSYGAENAITDFHGDYQGFDIVEPRRKDGNYMFLRVSFVPTKNEEYLAAYAVICREMELLWHNPLKSSWETVVKRIIKSLKKLGWQEVEASSDELVRKGIYFQYKGAK